MCVKAGAGQVYIGSHPQTPVGLQAWGSGEEAALATEAKPGSTLADLLETGTE